MNYEEMREYQNKKWAESRLIKGVSLAKEKKFHEAIKCYNQALQTCGNYADVYTARGAAFANLSQLNEAINDLKKAIDIDPHHPNARNYLEKITLKISSTQRIHEKDKDSDDERLRELIKKDGVDKMYDVLLKKSKKSKKSHKHSHKKEKRKRDEGSISGDEEEEG